MITEKQYEQMLDALVDQLRALNGIAYVTPRRIQTREDWRPYAQSMLNDLLIIGGIIVVGDDS